MKQSSESYETQRGLVNIRRVIEQSYSNHIVILQYSHHTRICMNTSNNHMTRPGQHMSSHPTVCHSSACQQVTTPSHTRHTRHTRVTYHSPQIPPHAQWHALARMARLSGRQARPCMRGRSTTPQSYLPCISRHRPVVPIPWCVHMLHQNF